MKAILFFSKKWLLLTLLLILVATKLPTLVHNLSNDTYPPPKGSITKYRLITIKDFEVIFEPHSLPQKIEDVSYYYWNEDYWRPYRQGKPVGYTNYKHSYGYLLKDVYVQDAKGKKKSIPYVLLRHSYSDPALQGMRSYIDNIIQNPGWAGKKRGVLPHLELRYLYVKNVDINLESLTSDYDHEKIIVKPGAYIPVYVLPKAYEKKTCKNQGEIQGNNEDPIFTYKMIGNSVVDYVSETKGYNTCEQPENMELLEWLDIRQGSDM